MFTVLIAFAVLIAVFLIRGWITPSVSYQTKIAIDQDVDTVFAFFNDLEKTPLWISGLKKIEALSGVPGATGFRSRYYFEEGGRTTEFTEEVLEVKEKERFIFKLDSRDLTSLTTTRLTPVANGAEITMDNVVSGKSFLMKMMLPWVKGQMLKRQTADLQRLKGLVEAR